MYVCLYIGWRTVRITKQLFIEGGIPVRTIYVSNLQETPMNNNVSTKRGYKGSWYGPPPPPSLLPQSHSQIIAQKNLKR